MSEPIKKAGKALWNVSLYTLSIPERYLRGLTALTGGMLKETTDIVVPDFVQDTTSYNIFVGNLLRFAVENVGGVEGLYDEEQLEGEYATRKVIGNAIEGVGIATVHASPRTISYTNIKIYSNNTSPNSEFVTSNTSIRICIFSPNLNGFIIPIMGCNFCISAHENLIDFCH